MKKFMEALKENLTDLMWGFNELCYSVKVLLWTKYYQVRAMFMNSNDYSELDYSDDFLEQEYTPDQVCIDHGCPCAQDKYGFDYPTTSPSYWAEQELEEDMELVCEEIEKDIVIPEEIWTFEMTKLEKAEWELNKKHQFSE